MLNEDKIRLMTRITMFEKRERKNLLTTNRYFKGDYVSKLLLHSFFGYTLSAGLVAVIWVLYHIESLLRSATIESLLDLGKNVAIYYVVGLLIYLFITTVVALMKYRTAKKMTKQYLGKLRHLEKRYEFQNKSKELTKGGRHHEGSSRI